MNCSSLSEVPGLHDSPSAEISRLLNPSLSDDKNDQMSSDIGLDFGESSKFDPDSVLGSSYSLGREGDETDDLDLSITPSFETGLSCSPPSCFDSISTSSSSTATVQSTSLTRCITSSGIPPVTSVTSGGSSTGPGVPGQLLNQLNAGTVVIGNVTAQSLVSAVLNAKKSAVTESGMNTVSVTPAAAGIWVLNTPPININPDILQIYSQAQSNTSVGNSMLGKEASGKVVSSLSTGTPSSCNTVTKDSDIVGVTDTTDNSCPLQDGTHVVLKSQDTREVNPTSFLRLEDILMKHNPVSSNVQPELPKNTSTDTIEKETTKRLLLSKSEGSESNSFSELFSFQDLPSNADVTQTKQMSDCLPLTNMTTLAPDQPILQCSSSEEFQETEDKSTPKDTTPTEPPPAKPAPKPGSENKKFTAPTLIIEGLQEGSKLVKNLPTQKVPILPKDPEGQTGSQDLKHSMPVTCEEKSTPVLVHLIRNSDFSNKDILYCQNIQTTLTEDLGQEMMDADLDSSSEEEKGEDGGEIGPPPQSQPQVAEVVPTAVQPRKKYQKQKNKPKVFKCDLCNAKFDLLGNYTRHRKIHKIDSNNSQHKCEICERSFLQRCDMKRHMLIHTKQEPHRCPTCGKGYIRKSDLVVHMRFHSKERPYKCEECSKEYCQSGDLKRHIRKCHTKGVMLLCGHCKREYATESTLIRHMQTQHKDIILKSLNQKLTEESTKESKETSQNKGEPMVT